MLDAPAACVRYEMEIKKIGDRAPPEAANLLKFFIAISAGRILNYVIGTLDMSFPAMSCDSMPVST
jgi:hypothetical protein